MSEQGKVYTRDEAIEALGVRRNTFKSMVAEGVVRALPDREGRKFLYSVEAIHKVRDRLYPEGLSFMDIAKKYGVARNTVKKYVREAKFHPLGYNLRVQSYVFDPAQVASLAESLGWQENRLGESSSQDSEVATTF